MQVNVNVMQNKNYDIHVWYSGASNAQDVARSNLWNAKHSYDIPTW